MIDKEKWARALISRTPWLAAGQHSHCKYCGQRQNRNDTQGHRVDCAYWTAKLYIEKKESEETNR